MFGRIRNIIKEYNDLKFLAYHDSLTGLLNRNWLHRNLSSIKCQYVYFIDINDLHRINEKGHAIGDKFIVDIVKSIKLVPGETLIRYAGDEFILLSNRSNAIGTNKKYSVGMATNKGEILGAICNADINMLKSKRTLKKSQNESNNSGR